MYIFIGLNIIATGQKKHPVKYFSTLVLSSKILEESKYPCVLYSIAF